MRTKLKWGLSLITLYASVLAAPNVSVDRTHLNMNDTLTLQIVDESAGTANPDLSPLATDFNVVSTMVSAEMQNIQGKITQKKTWSIVLTPKRSGTLSIPSLNIGSDKTDPIHIEIATINTSNTSITKKESIVNQQAPIFIETSIAPKSVYEGQAGLYTLKIYYNTSVREPALSIPSMDNAKLIHVGKDTTQPKTINGQNYQVLEQHYAVIGKQDGILELQGPTLQGFRLNLSQKDAFSNPWQAFNVKAPSVSLKINTVPGMTKSSWWLPSTKVSLTDSWANNPPHFQSGVPITRTLILSAHSITAEQLPTIAPTQSDGFQLYADKPILNTDSNGFQLQATRTEKIAYLPNADGKFTIPEINVDWWNTDSNSPKKIIIPAYTVTVAAGSNVKADPQATSTPAVLSLGDPMVQPSGSPRRLDWYKRPFFILSLLLASAWVVTVVLWWRSSKPKSSVKGHHHVHAKEELKTLRQLRTDLRIACQQNNALDAKEALLAIAKIVWPYETVLSVGDLAEKFNQSTTKDLLQELESVLYKEATVWHGAQLWTLLDEEFRIKAKASRNPEELLPHLYLEEKE